MNADGSNRAPLLHDDFPSFGPISCDHGRYAIFASASRGGGNSVNIWRADAMGGNLKQLTTGTYDQPAMCSPDGKWLAFQTQPTTGGRVVIKILDFETLAPVKILERYPRAGGEIRYTSDGKTIGYPIRENGLYALWVSPVDGSPGHRVTEFEADRIDDFHWTPDGKILGLLRTHSDSDVVLLRQTSAAH